MEISSGSTGRPGQNRRYYIDFDEWSKLAGSDPAQFEKRRRHMLDDFLAQFPENRQRRLRGLQFQIDMERRKAKTPLAACIRLSNMMWDSVEGEKGLLNTIKLLRTGSSGATRKIDRTVSAQIFPFPVA